MGAIIEKKKLVSRFAERYGVDDDKLLTTLRHTCFSDEVTNAQMAALLIVAEQHGLNPFTKEIYAFPHKGGIVPVVGVDGWARIINENKQFDGMDFVYSEKTMIPDDSVECHEWVECRMFRKDRTHPIAVREYINELYKPLDKYPDGNKKKPGPWQSHPKRMMRHKAMIQAARIAFGYSGIYDQDEAFNIVASVPVDSLEQKQIESLDLDDIFGKDEPAAEE